VVRQSATVKPAVDLASRWSEAIWLKPAADG
jgi:hypothetical protein